MKKIIILFLSILKLTMLLYANQENPYTPLSPIIIENYTDSKYDSIDFTYANFSNISAENIKFSSSSKKRNYSNATFENSALGACEWAYSTLNSVNFYKSSFLSSYVNPTGGYFYNSNLGKAIFDESTFNNTNDSDVFGACFAMSNLKDASLKNVSYLATKTTLSQSSRGYVEGLSIQDTVLTNADFSGSKIRVVASSTAREAMLAGIWWTSRYVNIDNVNMSRITSIAIGASTSHIVHGGYFVLEGKINNLNLSNSQFSATTQGSGDAFGLTFNTSTVSPTFNNLNMSNTTCYASGTTAYGLFVGPRGSGGGVYTFKNSNFSNSIFSGTTYGAYFDGSTQFYDVDFSNSNFSGQFGAIFYGTLTNVSFQNSNFSSVSFYNYLKNVDLRGANTGKTLNPLSGLEYENEYIYQNVIMNDGTIKHMKLNSSNDNFSILKYTPATMNGVMISAKITENVDILGNSILTLEQGAELEILNSAALTVNASSKITINTDTDSSTSFTVGKNAALTFDDGAILAVNAIIDAEGAYTFTVLQWENSAVVKGIEKLLKETTLLFTVNGVRFSGEWNTLLGDNFFAITASVPEPAAFATLFGALALALSACRKRK